MDQNANIHSNKRNKKESFHFFFFTQNQIGEGNPNLMDLRKSRKKKKERTTNQNYRSSKI